MLGSRDAMLLPFSNMERGLGGEERPEANYELKIFIPHSSLFVFHFKRDCHATSLLAMTKRLVVQEIPACAGMTAS
jgi:hypothetical protein